MTKMFKQDFWRNIFYVQGESPWTSPPPPTVFLDTPHPQGNTQKNKPGAALRGDLQSDPSGLGRLLVCW